MRIGRNPLTDKKAPYKSNLIEIVASVITHLPNEEGYHSHRLEVIKMSLESLLASTSIKPHILIWDNGSCNALTDWLREEYKPDTLILSHNIGKSSARSFIANMLPNDTILAIADDDILYYPGWLTKQIELLKHFPNVGSITGNPIRTAFRWGCNNTMDWCRKNGKLLEGRYIPDRYEYDFCVSIGRDYMQHAIDTKFEKDFKVIYKGLEAYTHSHHCQFVCYADTIKQFCKITDEALPEEKSFDIAIDLAGYLRLCTTTRYTRHIGNFVDESIQKDYDSIIEEINNE